MEFKEFGLAPQLLEGLDAIGFEKATPVQELAIPPIIEGHDIIACAQTGTGKTAAYILPLLHKILEGEREESINTLIIAPTRELAQQIDQQIEGLSYFTSVSSAPVYGGGDGTGWDTQKKALLKGCDIITATPGRLIALLASGAVRLNKLKHLVLDEADRMLDMGFYDDIVRISSHLPVERQTLLFSATMPPKIRLLATKLLKDPKEINIAVSKPAEGVLQQAYMVYDSQKEELVKNLLQDEGYQSVIIFASTKEKVKSLGSTLKKAGFAARAFHSDLDQEEREQNLRAFKSRELRILVGTDVISRGIDIEGISLVINYDCPPDPEDYIHRIGRTARAATKGVGITFINEKDQHRFVRIEELIGTVVPKLPLPTDFGPAPEYNPALKPKPDFRKKRWKQGAKKPFKK